VILYSQPWNQQIEQAILRIKDISNNGLSRISNLSEAVKKIKSY